MASSFRRALLIAKISARASLRDSALLIRYEFFGKSLPDRGNRAPCGWVSSCAIVIGIHDIYAQSRKKCRSGRLTAANSPG